MKVCVRLFAGVRQAAGCDRLELELPEGATVAVLQQQIVRAVPLGPGLARHLLIAFDSEYAGDQDPIPPGAEVACIPPLSGG